MVRALGASRLPVSDIVLPPALQLDRGGCPYREAGSQVSGCPTFVACQGCSDKPRQGPCPPARRDTDLFKCISLR